MQAWEKFLSLQEAELGVETVNKWLRSLQVERFDACNLYLKASSSFQILWFEEHIRKKAQASLFNNNRKKIAVHLNTDDNSSSINDPASKETNKRSDLAETAHADKANQIPIEQFSLSFDASDPNCRFDTFVPSESNPLPHKVLFQVTGYDEESKKLTSLKNEPAIFNPIYLYGPKGSGKTHLMMAAAQAMQAQGLSVIYVRAETFTDHVVSAIRAGEMSKFRQMYRNIDVLIIDDVHIFSRKWATQEELFHTFNALHVSGKQMIFGGNTLPREFQNIEPRLISRFEWGIVLPLASPQKADLRNILLAKTKALNYLIGPKIIDFFVETFSSSSKALTRAFEALILRVHLKSARVRLSPTQLTIPYVRQQLEDLILLEKDAALTPQKIIQNTAGFFGIRPEDILGKTQSRDCSLPRHLAMYLCRTQLKIPYMKIGDIFAKDHSTVMSSVKLVQKGLDNSDEEIINSFNGIVKALKA